MVWRDVLSCTIRHVIHSPWEKDTVISSNTHMTCWSTDNNPTIHTARHVARRLSLIGDTAACYQWTTKWKVQNILLFHHSLWQKHNRHTNMEQTCLDMSWAGNWSLHDCQLQHAHRWRKRRQIQHRKQIMIKVSKGLYCHFCNRATITVSERAELLANNSHPLCVI